MICTREILSHCDDFSPASYDLPACTIYARTQQDIGGNYKRRRRSKYRLSVAIAQGWGYRGKKKKKEKKKERRKRERERGKELCDSAVRL